MSWIVSTEVINPFGICLGEELNAEDYNPYTSVYRLRHFHNPAGEVGFQTYLGNDDQSGNRHYTHKFSINMFNLAEDYIRRVYNLSDDTEIDTTFISAWNTSPTISRGAQYTFETEAEALEYVDGLGNPISILTVPHDPNTCLLYTSPSPRDRQKSRMPSSA